MDKVVLFVIVIAFKNRSGVENTMGSRPFHSLMSISSPAHLCPFSNSIRLTFPQSINHSNNQVDSLEATTARRDPNYACGAKRLC